jgi:putative ABC transport system substrate-binding protein
VIVTTGGGTTSAAQANSQTIPIVVVGAGNPIGNNIASPEGNVTGFSILYPSLGERWLQLLREVAPHLARVAVIGYPTDDQLLPVGSTSRQFSGQYRASIAEAAQALGVNAIITEFRNDSELERAIDTFADQPEGGLIALPGTRAPAAGAG